MIWRLAFKAVLEDFGKSDFEAFVCETEADCVRRVAREHRNRSRWFIVPMHREGHMDQDPTMHEPTWGCTAPVPKEAYLHISALMSRIVRLELKRVWGPDIDKRHKAIILYCLILMLCYNNNGIPPECLDIREFYRNLMNYNITKEDILRFDSHMAENGEVMLAEHMRVRHRHHHRGIVGLSTLPPKDDLVTIEPLLDDDLSRLNYRLVVNYEGQPTYFKSYSRKHDNFNEFMKIVDTISKRYQMRRIFCVGDTNQLWTREPNVMTEIRYNDLPWSMEQHIMDIYRRRNLHMAYYEHNNYEFTLQDPTTVMGRRLIIFNMPDLVIERRQYRALRILKLSKTIKAINKEFLAKGVLNPKPMFNALFRRFGHDDFQKLSRFVMVSFHDVHGLYMVVDKKAIREGSVMDKLCVATTTTASQFLNTPDFGFMFRNFLKSRVYFETDFWKRHRLLQKLGFKNQITIDTMLLLSAFLRYYLLFMVY
jgi:hypothetical protein